MNILFTCVGRRNYLIEYFKALKGVRIVACDASRHAPGLYTADEYFLIPEVFDPDYISILINEAKARGIDAIIPLNDLELPALSENLDLFASEGIRVIVSDREIIDICSDKYRTVSFTGGLSVSKIPTFLNPGDALNYKKRFPDCRFIIKPRWGSASAGIEYQQDEEELVYLFNLTRKRLKTSVFSDITSGDTDNNTLIQKMLTGQEYGMDVINDLEANYQATLIRKKIAMRAGETDKAETVFDERLNRIGEEIGRKLKHTGMIDCDLFVENDKIYLLEMNPRFGGGYPFLHFAGANYPLALAEWLKGNKTPEGCLNYRSGIISAKVDKIIGIKVKG